MYKRALVPLDGSAVAETILPFILEIAGPLFMSYPVTNNLQYRLSEQKDGTVITFHHTALGLIVEDHRKGVSGGWAHIHQHVKQRAESLAAKAARR